MKRNCRWPGCRKKIEEVHWGCLEHWEKLPANLKSVLTYAKFQLHGATTSAMWREACTAATDWANAIVKLGPLPAIDPEKRIGELGPHTLPGWRYLPCCLSSDGTHRPGCRFWKTS